MSIQRQLTNERMSQVVVHNGTVYLSGQVGDDMTAGTDPRGSEQYRALARPGRY